MTSLPAVYGPEEEYEQEDEEERMVLTAASALVIREEEACLKKAARRQHSQTYLTHPVLLPDPHENMPWTALFDS